MKLFGRLGGALIVVCLVGCGGGGGSGIVVSSGNSSVKSAVITLNLVDADNVLTTYVDASQAVLAKATVRDANGKLVEGLKVTFSSENNLIKLSPAPDVLTINGVATVQVSAASLSAVGAGTISASAVFGGVNLLATKDFQLSSANLSLTDLNVGSASLAAYDNRQVSVVAKINGVAATSTPVVVTFSASCGEVSPALITTDANGRASTTYTASEAQCAGTNVFITANSAGLASPVSSAISVAPITATNIQFVDARPAVIYLLSSGAATQSQVRFKVVDSVGNPIQHKSVRLELINSVAGVGLSLDTLGNVDPVTKFTGSDGVVGVAVFSGNVPTSMKVQASLLPPDSLVQTTSSQLVVASGRPVQKSASLSLEKFSIEGWSIDGVTTSVTLSVADRQGNPVPQGTEVNFVAESGVMIPPTCVIQEASQCSSTHRSSGTRPLDGRVSILAYVPGEEDFTDFNFNNSYDAGEPFVDLGNAFRDDNEDGRYTAGEFSVLRAGGLPCSVESVNGRSNSCDGIWGPIEVRQQVVVVYASSRAYFDDIVVGAARVRVRIKDVNGNSMPAGSSLSAESISFGVCTIMSAAPDVIANRYGPQDIDMELDGCNSGDRIRVLVRTPSGFESSHVVTIP